MPAYYPRDNFREPSLTPEYVQQYTGNGCGNMRYQSTCGAWVNHTAPEHWGLGPQLGMGSSATVMYQQPGYALSQPNLTTGSRYYDSMRAPTLPPMNYSERHSMVVDAAPHVHRLEHPPQSAPQPKEEKPVGGVSAKLDYELDCMTDFVVEMTQAIIFPGGNMHSTTDFKQWVNAMLSATRLPSATIAMGLHYLTLHLERLSRTGRFFVDRERMHTLITTGLTLGSKFLDDNTFINRSWSDVSGIAVAALNREELEWLKAMEWTLHRDPNEDGGFASWLGQWKEYEARVALRAEQASRNKLAPINTSLHRQSSVQTTHNKFSPNSRDVLRSDAPHFVPASAQSYHTPVHTPYESWTPRSSLDASPVSAPHSGPTTPEFYYGAHMWNHPEGYSRRTMFGLQPVMQPVAHQQPFCHDAYPQYAPAVWNGHDSLCLCMHCSRSHHSMFPFHGQPYHGQPVIS